ncbi:MAG: ATP-grasp domain-containing protein, partial [Gemmatimonadetes bacterium]|nr:ATP-grasp domain-containing protein [Gemmatimonadota bacterium]
MLNVAFVAPFYLPTTLRFLEATARLPDVRLGVVTQEPLEKAPAELRQRIASYARVEDALRPAGIESGLQRISAELGSVDRLLGALEELQVPLGELRDRFGIAGMGADAALNFRDKSRMKDVLRAHELPCAQHALAHSATEGLQAAERIGFPLIVKPPAGSGARGTFRVESGRELASVLSMSPPSAEGPSLLEEFVVGDEHSFDAVSIDGRIVWHSINHYFPTPLEVLNEPWIQWCVLLPREVDSTRYDAIRAVAGPVLDALGMKTGLSHMEWFRRSDGSIAI